MPERPPELCRRATPRPQAVPPLPSPLRRPNHRPSLPELNVADGTYELHPAQDEEQAADLHHMGVEPVQEQEQAEDPLTFSEPEGNENEFAANVPWPTQLPPSWSVEWKPSLDGEDGDC
ncbi:uncharacterized protein LOC101763450 [Setaria italica]|uniref:uncharacterized protein LOC101763450 n=1 Tax=Setaria italica TaxID=4555 RepID=UPI000351142E|nr:uncharacterized protein LOC101763450 [Setaria italica]